MVDSAVPGEKSTHSCESEMGVGCTGVCDADSWDRLALMAIGRGAADCCWKAIIPNPRAYGWVVV
jgi:hypothetical protein